jgi:hypothetical protein
MEYTVGTELQFKKNLGVSVWVDGILPAGQMNLKTTHLRICINKFHLDLPLSEIEELFEIKVDEPEETIIKPEPVIEEEVKKIVVEKVLLGKPKAKKPRKKKNA